MMRAVCVAVVVLGLFVLPRRAFVAETPCNPAGSDCCWDGWNDCAGDDTAHHAKHKHEHKRVAAREYNQACEVCADGVPYCDDGSICPDTEDDDDDKPA
jgi:hypothetical protein